MTTSDPQTPRTEAWEVHNHGPHQGRGTACREYHLNGRLVGACQIIAATGAKPELLGGYCPHCGKWVNADDPKPDLLDADILTMAMDYVDMGQFWIQEPRDISDPPGMQRMTFDRAGYAGALAAEYARLADSRVGKAERLASKEERP
jgi:hypothetical protein